MERENQSFFDDLDMYTSDDISIEGKELADAKAYLGIVMRELDEAKQQVTYYENVLSKPKKNAWKGFAAFELLLLVSVLTAGWFWYSNESQKAEEASNDLVGKYIETNEPEVNESLTYRKVDNLTSVIEAQTHKLTGNFTASIETLFGYEYLCFTNQDMKIYYRNEYPNDNEDDRLNVLIDNGKRLVEYNWEYDLSNFTNLCPYYGTYSADGTSQLVFPIYDMNKDQLIPKELRVVDATKLWEYSSIDIKEQVLSTLKTTYSEVISDVGTVDDTRMTISVNNADYLFSISKDSYINAVYYEEGILEFKDHFSIAINEDSIAFTGVLYVSDNEYLGEINGSIVLEDQAFTMKNFKFAAYAKADQEDEENGGVIKPREEILTEYISLYGKNRERFLIPISDVLEKNTFTNESFVLENDYKVYYNENGEKASKIGIDVSKYQGEIDWEQVKESDVDYAIIRLGFRGMKEGSLELDPYFLQNIEGATKAGVPVGIYFFSQAITNEEAFEEAQMVLEYIEGYEIAYPVVFDTEGVTTYNARANNLSRQARTDIAKTFCEEIKRAGYIPMLYANTKWMVMGVDLEQLTDYDLWFAYYGENLSFPYQFEMLQYSDSGKVPGIKGSVDLNISFVDYPLQKQEE